LKWLALPSEATLINRRKQLDQGLGKWTPIEWQRLSGALPKPFPIFIPLFYSGGQLVAFQTLDLVVLLIGIAVYALYADKRKRERALQQWEAQVQAETRHYAEQAARARRVADERNVQAIHYEQEIRNAIEGFEAEDREDAERHEAAKRALGYWGDGR